MTTYYQEPRPARKLARTALHTDAFARGIAWGKRGIFRGRLTIDQSEDGIVAIIQNLVEFALEGNLTEEQLRQDTGIVVGFVLSHPHLF